MKALFRIGLAVAAISLGISSSRALPPCAPMDFDADCKSDVLWRNTVTGENYMFLMNGSAIAAHGPVDFMPDQAWQIRGVGDFDGDGIVDILWRNSATGENYLSFMNGATIVSHASVNFQPDQAWQVAGVGDFDGDGRADILWRHTTTGENWVFLMNGSTIVSQGSISVVPDQAWQVRGVGDFDGDGRADILWRNSATGENYLHLMNGATVAAYRSVNFMPDQAWQIRGVGDFDGDGRADILWRNSATGESSLYLMDGATIASQGSINFVPDQAWQVAGVGDFDGDGRADILWRHTSSGENYVFFMTGWTIASQGYLSTVADLSWMPRTATTITDSTAPDRTAPSTPAGLSASAASSSRIDLSWRAAADNVGVAGYRVYRDGVHVADVSRTSHSSTGLSAETTYSYTIAAYDAAGNASTQSSASSATTRPAPDTQAPSTPANLGVTAVSSSQIDLSWSAATDDVGVTGYRVYRDGALVVSPAGTSVSITGLSATTLYSFAVSAVDAASNASAPSAPLSVTTSAPPDTTAPSAPADLAASAVDPTSLTLSWTAATDNVGVTGYRVYRDGTLADSPAGISVSINGLLAGTLYTFTVLAVDAAGNASPASAPLPVTTATPPDTTLPSTPTNLTATAVSSSQINLAWNASTDDVGVTGYRVYRGGALLTTLGNVTSYQNTGLTASTDFSYTVQALDAAGNQSAQSTAASATTQAPSAPDLVVISLSYASATGIFTSTIKNQGAAATPVGRDIGVAYFVDGVYRTWGGSFTSLAAGASMTIGSDGGAYTVPAGTHTVMVYVDDALRITESNEDNNQLTQTITVSASDTTAPSAPTGLAASAVDPTSLTLSWTAATDNVGVAGYRVYRDGTLVASSSSTSVSITGLLAGTLYAFTVSAFDAAGNASAPSAPFSVTSATPPPAPRILWTAGMELGSLGEFEGENNSGSADSIAVLAASEGIQARRGSWVMKQSVTGSSGGTRMYRYSTINSVYRTGDPIYYSFWAYFPQATHLSSSGFFNLVQIQSINPSGYTDPVWILGFHPTDFTLKLEWWSLLQMTGPHAGESGGKSYQSSVPIPVGQWVFIQVMVTPREDFTGAVKVWMNDKPIFDLANVRTKYPESLVPTGTQSFFIAKNAYGTGMTPIPNHHYLDDVAISLDPMPYAP